MEHIMNYHEQNNTPRQGMATQNQQTDWNVNPGTKRPPTNPEDKIALFAVPLPSQKKSDYLCLCKRLFWSVGSSYFTAFCPLSPDETRTLPLASTVVQLVCASPASQTDTTGNKRVPHDLLAYNEQGNIIGVPYLSIHRDTQQQGNQTKGIPYPDISNSAWVPALNVPFVSAPERQNKERLEDVVFIIRNEKHPSDILHQNGNMPMLFSKQDVEEDSPVLTVEPELPAAKESVTTSQQPKLGSALRTESHNALDLSQDGLTTLPKDPKLSSPETRQGPILPCPQKTVPSSRSPVAGRSANQIKATVSAASTSLYRAYNSKWKENKKGLSSTLTVDTMVAKDHNAETPLAPGSTNETCDAPHEMVLPKISSVFSLVDCSSPDENLPKRITDALLKNVRSDQNKLPSKSQHEKQSVQIALPSKKTDDPVQKSRDLGFKKQNKRTSKQKRFRSLMKPPLEQETISRQSATTPGIAQYKPIRPSCETLRQNAPPEQTMQIPAAPTSTVQFQQIMASVQPARQTNEKNPTRNFTEPDKQSSYRPTSPVQSPQKMSQLGQSRPLQEAPSLGSKEILPKEVSAKLPTESRPQTVENVFIDNSQVSTLHTTVGHGTLTNNTSNLYQGVTKKYKKNGLTVREILQRSRADREIDLPPVPPKQLPVIPLARYDEFSPTLKESGDLSPSEVTPKTDKIVTTLPTQTSSIATKSKQLPVIPLARYDEFSPTLKESGDLSPSEVTPKTDKIVTTLPTQTSSIATKSSSSHGIFSTSVPSSETSISNSRNVANDNTRDPNQTTVESDISRIGSVSKEQLSAQTLSATSVEISPAPCISKTGIPTTNSIPVGEITITKNLGLDKVKFVSSTEVVIDGKIPCLILDKINYNFHSVNLSSIPRRNCISDGIQVANIDKDNVSKVDRQKKEPLHEDQSGTISEGQSKSKGPLKNDSASIGNTKKKVQYRGRTRKKPKATRKPGINTTRSKSRSSNGLSQDIESNLRVSSQCFEERQSTASGTKKMRFSGKGSRRYALNVSKQKSPNDQIRKRDSQESTAFNFKANKVSTPVVHSDVDVEDWSGSPGLRVKGIDGDDLCNFSASSESDFAFSPKRLDPNDSDWDSSLEDNTPVYAFPGNLDATVTPCFHENFQHMTVEEKVRVLQETKQKHEMALRALKKM